MPDRRYALQNEEANRLIAALLDVAAVPTDRRGYFQHMLTTVLKLHEDGAPPGDLKITNTALKELRYAYKVFAPYRDVRKVTVFGSARTAPTQSAAMSALMFGRRMVEAGWMVVTGAGAGIMGAAQEGAGGERSFGLNIRLPFEQEANPWIASDPKLITFKYFFTRKLFLVKEASGIALFPGGFGTMDETFEVLTLMQTGKATIVPVVLVETDQTPYWRRWDVFVRDTLAAQGLIDVIDTSFYRIVDTVEDAVRELAGFYRVFHSARILGENLVFRLNHPLREDDLKEIQARFDDLLKGPVDQAPGPFPHEFNEWPDLPRLLLPFNRSSYARLRQLIDFVNTL
ncbi:MAG TPA: LOG family protein [Methylomirabilota bacterium]|nr:LOG family protein [Methylomirabilota bacterium]